MLSIKSFVFNPFGENTYLLYNESGTCAVIDPGNSSAMEDQQISSFIDDNHLKLRKIIITHAHVDHVAGIAYLAKRYGASVLLHPDAQDDFDTVRDQARYFGFGRVESYRGEVQLLEDDGQIEVGDSVLEVLCTPGHAPGSVSLFAPVEGWVFTGDALFCRSIGRTDFPNGDFDTLISSISTRLFVLPHDTEVFPGHGEATTIGEEKDFNPFFI